jgi:lipoate-protein ligase A
VSDDGAAWRLVVDLDVGRSAAEQMVTDLEMLAAVAEGAPPALRLYRWDPPALSLGRFQPETDVDERACERAGVDVVRRPTGGRALLHGGDLTYAVAMPRPVGAAGSVDAVYCHLAAGLIAGLSRLGVEATVARHDGRPTGPVCFTSMQGADLRVGTRKLCGSAQVRRGAGVLQHGSVLLRRLAVDEVTLLRPRPGVDRRQAREELRRHTVTLEELGVTADAHGVAEAIVVGFRSTLDVEFR